MSQPQLSSPVPLGDCAAFLNKSLHRSSFPMFFLSFLGDHNDNQLNMGEMNQCQIQMSIFRLEVPLVLQNGLKQALLIGKRQRAFERCYLCIPHNREKCERSKFSVELYSPFSTKATYCPLTQYNSVTQYSPLSGRTPSQSTSLCQQSYSTSGLASSSQGEQHLPSPGEVFPSIHCSCSRQGGSVIFVSICPKGSFVLLFNCSVRITSLVLTCGQRNLTSHRSPASTLPCCRVLLIVGMAAVNACWSLHHTVHNLMVFAGKRQSQLLGCSMTRKALPRADRVPVEAPASTIVPAQLSGERQTGASVGQKSTAASSDHSICGGS